MNSDVEAVENLIENSLKPKIEKNDSSQCAVFNDRVLRKGKRAAEIYCFRIRSSFSTASLDSSVAIAMSSRYD